MSILFWFQVGFGLLLILILIGLGIRASKDKTKLFDDEKILDIIKEELDKDGFNNFELKSIVSLNTPNITSVIVSNDYLEIAMEVDNRSGEIINKERLAR
ncbi:hypothetical protein [Candidatus Nitrosopumilus sediminis]|uniref:PepSY domain-containing protein n=1 Tax=Candidatus Nitrosopumilus sediminis TaxID=1229909 RepID=K0BB70_9ARCH|nr:hypothetical protein [Candidatus Nitrosopumilus sediminis]AFS83413.1 hypothetical protein NSED_08105 [Candidatus Nitrosopumilus sediminis]